MTALDAVIFLLKPVSEIDHPNSDSFFQSTQFSISVASALCLLTLHGILKQREFFVENQSPQAISACEALDRPFSMLKGTSADIGRDARIEHSMRTICHDVTNSRRHSSLETKKMTASSAVMMRKVSV